VSACSARHGARGQAIPRKRQTQLRHTRTDCTAQEEAGGEEGKKKTERERGESRDWGGGCTQASYATARILTAPLPGVLEA